MNIQKQNRLLGEYIDKQLNESIDYGCKLYTYINGMKEFYNNKIPNYLIYKILDDDYPDYIAETLNSHDVKLLIKKLQINFSFIKSFNYIENDENKKMFVINLLNKNDLNKLLNNDKFNNIITFFNYYITQIIDTKLILEPIYSENITNYMILNKFYYVYHITSSDKEDKIMEKGLRCKTSNYRYYPERIYFYISKYKFSYFSDDLKILIKKIINYDKLKTYGITLFKIKEPLFGNHNYSFYKDTTLPKNSVFIYNNVPASELIKIGSFCYNDIFN